MSQHRQIAPKLSMDIQSALSVDNEDPLSQADTLKIISCPICRATYISSTQQQAATPGSLALLESAFLSLCHKCFHCQRPACPQCWNPIHYTCAACCEEALLPFRSPVPSVEGLAFSARSVSQTDQAHATSFTCLHNGRFYTPKRTSSHETLRQNSPEPSYPDTAAGLLALRARQDTPDPTFSSPVWLRENTSQAGEAPANGLPSHASGQRKNDSSPGPVAAHSDSALAQLAQARSTVVLAQAAQPDWSHIAHALPHIPSLPAQNAVERVNGQRLLDDLLDKDEDEISLFERIENVLIIVISVLLLTIVLMIVLAISSPTMNTFFFHLLHIDIRSDILYLLQVR